MKKIVCMLLLFCLLTVPLGGCGKDPAEGEENSSDETSERPESPAKYFDYEENEEGGITITKYIEDDANVVIPAKINGKPVTRIGQFSFSISTKRLAFVKIPEGVTCIERSAFQDCEKLKKIELPNTLEQIYEYAFYSCPLLESISLPKGVKTVGTYAFAHCDSLKKVTLSDGLITIEPYAFEGARITEIVIPASVQTINENVFLNCFYLRQMKFEGNAPTEFSSDEEIEEHYTVYYHEGAKGFTSPTWEGHFTEIW